MQYVHAKGGLGYGEAYEACAVHLRQIELVGRKHLPRVTKGSKAMCRRPQAAMEGVQAAMEGVQAAMEGVQAAMERVQAAYIEGLSGDKDCREEEEVDQAYTHARTQAYTHAPTRTRAQQTTQHTPD